MCAFISLLAPNAVSHLTTEAVDSTSARLSWRPPSQPNGPITHYRILVLYRSTIVQDITLRGQVEHTELHEHTHTHTHTQLLYCILFSFTDNMSLCYRMLHFVVMRGHLTSPRHLRSFSPHTERFPLWVVILPTLLRNWPLTFLWPQAPPIHLHLGSQWPTTELMYLLKLRLRLWPRNLWLNFQLSLKELTNHHWLT